MHVLRTVRALALPDWRVFSGAIYQTAWNSVTGRHCDYGVRDFDLAYYDASDLSYEAEDVVIRRVAAAFETPLREMVEVRNQARVHLWFERKFGEPYTALESTDDALWRFVCPAFAVAVRLEVDDTLSVAAPFGLEDTFSMKLRPNPTRPLSNAWEHTTSSARMRWPEATIVRENAQPPRDATPA